MTDPYSEATREERRGMPTIAKVLLVAGGLLLAVVVAVAIWFSVAMDRWMDDILSEAEEVSLKLAQERRAAGTPDLHATAYELAALHPEGDAPPGPSVASLLAVETAKALDAILTEYGFSATAGEDPGLALSIETPNGSPIGFSFPQATEILDRVARGEARFADVDLGSAVDSGKMPEWVPVHPDARHSGSGFYGRGDSSFGVTVLVADAAADDVLDWYREAVDGAGLRGVRLVHTAVKVSVDGEPVGGQLDAHRFVATSRDRSLTVLATEDDHGGSLFVVAYKG